MSLFELAVALWLVMQVMGLIFAGIVFIVGIFYVLWITFVRQR